MIYLAIAFIGVGMFALICLMDEAIELAEETPPLEGPHWAGWGVDMTDHMAAEYRYEQAQQHA